MDAHSETLLADVHPDLAKVIRAASQAVPFGVTYGARSLSAEIEAIRTGHARLKDPKRSRHVLRFKGDRAHAVDVTPLVNGKPDFKPPLGVPHVYGMIATSIIHSARTLVIPVEWGAVWKVDDDVPDPRHFEDWGHFQLPWESYP